VLFENACPKSGVSPPLQIGGQKPPFSRISQLHRNFNGLYLSQIRLSSAAVMAKVQNDDENAESLNPWVGLGRAHERYTDQWSLTFVRPTQGVETRGNISSSFCTLAII